ncbi:MAG: hypothetical protein ACT4PV_16130 [Planctomycetaceae bacterium]
MDLFAETRMELVDAGRGLGPVGVRLVHLPSGRECVVRGGEDVRSNLAAALAELCAVLASDGTRRRLPLRGPAARVQNVGAAPRGAGRVGRQSMNWPAQMCGNGRTVGQNLLDVYNLATFYGETYHADLAKACLAHPPVFPHLNVAQHKQKVVNAWNASQLATPDWDTIKNELEHG